ncbi:MAG: DUF2905 domain-containing protein [Desulfobacterales bacterium]
MQKTLIIIGIVILAVGFLWPWLSRLPIGRLPGDIIVNRPDFKIYFPVTTGIVISLLISIILWLIKK